LSDDPPDDLPEDRIGQLLMSAASYIRDTLKAEGHDYDAVGLSLFLVRNQPHSIVAEFSRYSGDIAAIGMFAPEWAFSLTRDLLNEGPTEAFEGDAEEPVH
jgi:hypothetical protein